MSWQFPWIGYGVIYGYEDGYRDSVSTSPIWEWLSLLNFAYHHRGLLAVTRRLSMMAVVVVREKEHEARVPGSGLHQTSREELMSE